MTADALVTAAEELRRLHRIGKTPVHEATPEDAAFYREHPLRDLVGHGPEPDPRLLVADWLDSRAAQPVKRVHNHPPYEPICNERVFGGYLRGACLNDDGSDR